MGTYKIQKFLQAPFHFVEAWLHRLQNPKWPPGGLKMAEGVWKGVYPYVFGRSKQLSLNKFFDPSTPSMRKGCDGGKTKKTGGKKKKTGGKKKKKKKKKS